MSAYFAHAPEDGPDAQEGFGKVTAETGETQPGYKDATATEATGWAKAHHSTRP